HLVDGLRRATAEVIGGPESPARALPLVDEAEARHQEGEHAGGLVDRRWKTARRARLIMVLQKARRPALVLGIGQKVASDGAGVLSVQAIVKALVVGVIEPLLLG